MYAAYHFLAVPRVVVVGHRAPLDFACRCVSGGRSRTGAVPGQRLGRRPVLQRLKAYVHGRYLVVE